MNKIYKLIHPKYHFYILLFFISLICYGLFTPFLGFYHDEFSLLWFFKKMGDAGIMFEGNRPLQKFLFSPFILIFGSYYFLWVIFSIITRLLSVLTYYWILRQTWPEEKLLVATAAAAFLVYPGFQVQFSSLMYGIYFLSFFIFLLSIGLSIYIVKNTKYHTQFLFCSLLLSGISLFTSEYFFTLEAVRYFLLWVVIQKKSRIKEFFISSAPFLLLFLVAVAWRVSVQEGETTYEMKIFEEMNKSFFPALLNLLLRSLSDIWFTSISVWIKVLNPVTLLPIHGIRIFVLCILLAAGLGIGIYQYLRKINQKNLEQLSKSTFIRMFAFCILSLFFAGIPFWISGLPINQPYYYTRWTIPFMMGGSLLIPILVYRLFSNKGFALLILSFILAQGAGTQLLAANDFRHEQVKLNNFFWQLNWRIPSLKEGTVLFSDMLDFHYENSDQLSSGINFALSKKEYYHSIPYFLFFIPERYKTSVLPEIKAGIPLSGKRYYALFKGNTSQAILIDYQPPACLKILDPVLDIENPNLDELTKQGLFLSKPNLITDSMDSTLDPFSIRVIGQPPDDSWCYYFEKADASNQFKDWDEIASIFEKVEEYGYKPRDGREWVPFINGFAHLNDLDKAAQLTMRALEMNSDLKPLYCKFWSNFDLTKNYVQYEKDVSRIYKDVLDCDG